MIRDSGDVAAVPAGQADRDHADLLGRLQALTTLTDVPLVLIPQAMSPFWPIARICLLKISEKS